MKKRVLYIIDPLKPFKGTVLNSMSCLAPKMPEFVDFTDGEELTLEGYKEKLKNPGLIAVNESELNGMIKAYESSLETDLKEIDENFYMEMLEVLPPVRWTKGLVSYFFISEADYGDIHAFYAYCDGKYFTALRNINTEHTDLVNDVLNAASKQAA